MYRANANAMAAKKRMIYVIVLKIATMKMIAIANAALTVRQETMFVIRKHALAMFLVPAVAQTAPVK